MPIIYYSRARPDMTGINTDDKKVGQFPKQQGVASGISMTIRA